MRAQVRTATATDYAAFTSLFGELGVEDPAPSIDRWTQDLMFHTLVAEDAGNVRGYVSFYKLGHLGHVRNLVVARDARNNGVGRTLMGASAEALRAAGAAEWHLNVKANNAAAIHLYESLGMRAEHRSTVVRIRWDELAALPAELATVVPVSADPYDGDDDIERAFGMPAGRIAMARRPDRVLVQLRDRDLAVIGFTAFDPEFPGASPFRVARPELAATLLAAVRKHARHDYLQIVVENHDALCEAFVAAGATVRLQLLHYSGPLH